MIALLAVLLAVRTADDPKPCDVRIYVLDKNQKPAALNGVTALLVTEDRDGLEKLLPLTLVTDRAGSDRAPNCALKTRPVDGTGLSVSLCAIGRPCPLEGRGAPGAAPRPPAQDEPAEPQDDVDVDFVVPYFKGRIPADHLCSPGCRASIRLAIAGTFHSSRSFPCPAGWTSGAPTCCLHHQLVAECSEARRHLTNGDEKAATVDLDRIDKILLRVSSESVRKDGQILVAWARSALADREPSRARSAIQELKSLLASRLEACGGSGTSSP